MLIESLTSCTIIELECMIMLMLVCMVSAFYLCVYDIISYNNNTKDSVMIH